MELNRSIIELKSSLIELKRCFIQLKSTFIQLESSLFQYRIEYRIQHTQLESPLFELLSCNSKRAL